jgi:hypothetical protein
MADGYRVAAAVLLVAAAGVGAGLRHPARLPFMVAMMFLATRMWEASAQRAKGKAQVAAVVA